MTPSRGRRRAVRKRYAYTRAREKRSRPKTPAPKIGWRIADLSRLCAIPVRTLRHYVTVGIIRPLEFRGTATRYSRREFLRLLRLIRMRMEGRLRLSEVRRRLDALSDPDLETWIGTQPLAPHVRAALGLPAENGAAAPSSTAAAALAGQPAFGGAAVETWLRVRLLPGLELTLSSDASPAVRRIARAIYDEYIGPLSKGE